MNYPDEMFEEAERREAERKALDALERHYEENGPAFGQLAYIERLEREECHNDYAYTTHYYLRDNRLFFETLIAHQIQINKETEKKRERTPPGTAHTSAMATAMTSLT